VSLSLHTMKHMCIQALIQALIVMILDTNTIHDVIKTLIGYFNTNFWYLN